MLGGYGVVQVKTVAFTGQYLVDYIELYWYNSRWYDPALGRFTQADSIVPDRGNPAGLDRYAYVANNPVVYNDPAGNCWGVASGIRGLPSYGTTCNNLDMALTIVQSSETSTDEKVLAGGYIAAEGLAHAGLVIGAAGVTCGLVGACAAAVESAIGIGTGACADGDCTNEATIAVNGAQRASQSIWTLSNFDRGAAIEKIIGGRSPGMPFNFPVIDRFKNGVATSIKSINLNAKSYQDISTMTSKVKGYINSLANFQGARWGGFNISSSQISIRELILAIPPGASEAQMKALLELEKWALTENVTLILQVIE